MAINKELEKLIVLRTIKETSAELWPNGPNIWALLDRFVEANVSATNLDSWLPLGGPGVQELFATYFLGAARRLADILRVHEQVALVALMYSAHLLFPGKATVDTVKLISSLEKPSHDSTSMFTVLFRLGERAVDQWLNSGIESAPPTGYFAKFKALVDRKWKLDPSLSNPGGSEELFRRLISTNPSIEALVDIESGRVTSAGETAMAVDTREIEWKALCDESSVLFKEGVRTLERALEVALEALNVAEDAFGPDHPNLAESLGSVALLHRTRGQFTEAEPFYKRSLAIRENASVPEDRLTESLEGLATVYYAQGQYAQAEPLLKRSLAIKESRLDADEVMNKFRLIFIKPVRERLAEIQRKIRGTTDL